MNGATLILIDFLYVFPCLVMLWVFIKDQVEEFSCAGMTKAKIIHFLTFFAGVSCFTFIVFIFGLCVTTIKG